MNSWRDILKNTATQLLQKAAGMSRYCILTEILEKPERYREIIEILGEEEILPREFAERFAPSMGFRNILVHRYAEVDLDELYQHLQNDLEDFNTFAKCVARYVEGKK